MASEQKSKTQFSILLSDVAEMLGEKESVIEKKLKALEIEPVFSQGKAYLLSSDARILLQKKGYKYSPQVISFQMLKGGVAKTTSCLNIGLRAHMYGARVLFMDLDQQANLSFSFGVDDLDAPVFVDVIEGKTTLKKAIVQIAPGLDLLPSSLNNSVIERVLLSGHRNMATLVKNALKEVSKDYDLIVIDTAPALSALNTAVSCASTTIVLPVTPDKFTLFGLQKHLADLKTIRDEYGVKFEERILFTRFDTRESASQVYLEQCIEKYGKKLLNSYVRQNTDIRHAIGAKKTLFDSKNKGKEDYDLVTREMMSLWS